MDEEEEMWFNEEDDFDDNEAVVPATATDILSKKLDTDLDSIGKMMDKKMETNGPKVNNNSSSPKSPVLNNNANAAQQTNTTTGENKSALFKRVSCRLLFYEVFCVCLIPVFVFGKWNVQNLLLKIPFLLPYCVLNNFEK